MLSPPYMAANHKIRLLLGNLKVTDDHKQKGIRRGRTPLYLIILLIYSRYVTWG